MNVYEKLADPVALTVFVLTLFLPVIVGFLTLRRTRSQSDFFVALAIPVVSPMTGAAGGERRRRAHAPPGAL